MPKKDKFENVDKVSSQCVSCGETRSDPVSGIIDAPEFGPPFPVVELPEDIKCCSAPRYRYLRD